MIHDSVPYIVCGIAGKTDSGFWCCRSLVLRRFGGCAVTGVSGHAGTGGVSTIHHQQAITIRRSTTTAQLAVGSQTPECEEVESNQQEVSLRDEEGDASKHE